MARLWTDNAETVLASSVSAGDNTITVAAGKGDLFPVVAAPNYALVTLENVVGDIEIVKVTARNAGADTMTVSRAQDGTTARAWSAGDIASLRPTASAHAAYDAHLSAAANAHAASAIANTPSGNIAATTVQAAINELDAEKEPFGSVAAHAAAVDPHPQYLTPAEGDAAYQPLDTQLGALSGLTVDQTNALLSLSAYVASLLNAVDQPAFRTATGAAADASTQSIWIPAGAIKPTLTNGAVPTSIELGGNNTLVTSLDFDPATQKFGTFSIPMPKGTNEAGTLKLVFEWTHTATTTNFGVAWDVKAKAGGDGDDIDAVWGTPVQVNDVGGTTNARYKTAITATITPAGTWTEGDTITFLISRVATDATNDTMTINAKLLGVSVYYQTASLNDA